MVIDLHHMNRNEAIRFFIDKYNEILGKGHRGEIEVIHGYGSSGKGGIIKKEFKEFLLKHKDYLDYEVDVNPGMTRVYPKKKINDVLDIISQDILEFCTGTPRSLDKIKNNFFKKYRVQEINSCVKRLVKKGELEKILKKNGDVFKRKGG